MPSLEGKHVVVTGAAGGIGSLVASDLDFRGAHVVGVDRVGSPMCRDMMLADLASEEDLDWLCNHLRSIRCDILVNLAGVQHFGPFCDQSDAGVRRDLTINLTAPTLLARAVLPGMVARRSGRIVNIGSVLGAIPFAHFATYSSAKAGLKALSDALRRELAGTGVSITHVSPRAVRTALCSDQVLAFAAATKMPMDAPGKVASRIVQAIEAGSRDVVIGASESLFIRLNALAPALVDRALAANDRKAAALFRKTTTREDRG